MKMFQSAGSGEPDRPLSLRIPPFASCFNPQARESLIQRPLERMELFLGFNPQARESLIRR